MMSPESYDKMAGSFQKSSFTTMHLIQQGLYDSIRKGILIIVSSLPANLKLPNAHAHLANREQTFPFSISPDIAFLPGYINRGA
jgi:hypothetical protein